MKYVLNLIILVGILTGIPTQTQAKWEQLNGPTWGIFSTLASSGTTIFTGMDGGGIYRSTDFGMTWTAMNNGLPANARICAIAVRNTTVFAIVYEKGVYYSPDNGMQWIPVNNGLPAINDIDGGGIAINDSFAFVAITGYGVFRSADNGTTWSSVNNGLKKLIAISIAADKERLFVGTAGSAGADSHAFFSTNNGNTWVEADSGLSGYISGFAINGNVTFASSQDGAYRTENNGKSWTMVLSFPPNGSSGQCITFCDNNIFVATNRNEIFYSTDSGIHWKNISLGTTVLSLTSTANKVFAGTYSLGVFQFDETNLLWKSANKGLATASPNKLAVVGKNLFTRTFGKIDRTQDGGSSWEMLQDIWMNDIAATNSMLFAGSYYENNFFVSSDNGSTWSSRKNGLPDSCACYNIFIADQTIYIGTNHGIYRSSNYGHSWVFASSGIPNFSRPIGGRGNEVFSTNGQGTIFHSTTSGALWSKISSPDPNSFIEIRTILLFDSTILIGTRSGIYHSVDSSKTWTFTEMPDNAQVNTLKQFGQLLCAGTNKGVFVSITNHTQWVPLNAGFKNNQDVLSFEMIDQNLYAGITSAGVWRYSLDSLPQAKQDSLFTLKITVPGDSLDYGYALLSAPSGMTISPGGTINWMPKVDSSYYDFLDYIIVDDEGNKDTISTLVRVNRDKQSAVINKQNQILRAEFSVTSDPIHNYIRVTLPAQSSDSKLFLFDLSGRKVDELLNITSTSVNWLPTKTGTGCYILKAVCNNLHYSKKISITR